MGNNGQSQQDLASRAAAKLASGERLTDDELLALRAEAPAAAVKPPPDQNTIFNRFGIDAGKSSDGRTVAIVVEFPPNNALTFPIAEETRRKLIRQLQAAAPEDKDTGAHQRPARDMPQG